MSGVGLVAICFASFAADRAISLASAPQERAVSVGEIESQLNNLGGVERLPVTTISSLSRELAATNNGGLVRVRGTVLDQRLGEYLVVSDATGNLVADTRLTVMPKLKQAVNVIGTPVWDGSSIRLKNSICRVVEPESSEPKEAALDSVRPATLPVLTKAWQVRDLTPEKAAWHYPVKLRAVVTYFVKDKRLCVQDDISGIYISMKGSVPDLKMGDMVQIEGVSVPGGYAPVVEAANICLLGEGELPEARQVTVYQLASSQEGSQWVEVQGVAQSVSFTNGEVRLVLNDPTGRLPVTIPAAHEPTNLLDAVIRIRGISASTSNSRRQFLGPTMLSPSLDYVQIEEPGVADPLNLPVRPVVSLSQFRPRLTLERRVNIGGVVTLCQPGQWFFLQDENDGVQVFTSQTEGFKPGVQVKAAGYPALGGYGSVLRNALCRVEQQGPLPKPEQLKESKPIDPHLQGRWVTLEADLLDHNQVGDTETFKLQFGGKIIEAACLNRSEVKPIRIGSRLQVTGVYVVLADDSRTPVSFQLLVPDGRNVQMLHEPSWWTSEHTILAVGSMAAIIGLAALWVLMLRRKVRGQTATLQHSELKFRLLVEQSLVGVYILQDGQFVYMNPRGAEIYGYTVAEMLAPDTLKDMVFPEDLPLVQEQLRRRLTGEIKTAQYTFRGVRKDGRIIHLEVLGVQTEFEGRTAVLGTALDITERKRAEAAVAEAGALLDTLLENCPDCIYFKDRASRFVHFSQSFAELLDLEGAAKLAGRSDFDFFTEEHARPAFEDEQRIIATGEPIIGKLEKETHSSGRITWALTTKQPWRDQDGNIIGTFGISKDVTAIKEAEQKLAQERELFRALVENLPDAIYYKDLQSRFVRFSKSKMERARQILLKRHRDANPGQDTGQLPVYLTDLDKFAEYLIGKTDFDVYPEARARTAFEEEQEIIRTGQPMIGKIDKTERLDTGEIVWYHTTKLPWRDPQGNIIGTLGVTRDITELKEAEAKLEAAHQCLVETSRLAGMAEVATDVLHNVGNVLNSVNVTCSLTVDRIKSSKISGLSKVSAMLEDNRSRLGEFFSSDPRGQQIPGYLKALAEHLTGEQSFLTKELEQLAQHIDHIKQIVAMQQSYAKVSGTTESVSLTQLVEDALHINASALVRHDVQVCREFEETPPVVTEKHKVLQILVNLIRNAKYAMDEGESPAKLLTLKVGTDGNGHAKIQVIDTGVGIPPENLTRIFAHGFTTRKTGHGFGLHSSALSVRDLGGSLLAESPGPGRGATFTLLLPCKFPVHNPEQIEVAA